MPQQQQRNEPRHMPGMELITEMASSYGMDPLEFMDVLRSTVIKDATDAQFLAYLMIAKEYKLNPLTKEIWAYPDRGGIMTIVSVDGWLKMINDHAMLNGIEFEDRFDDQDRLVSITCSIWRRDRDRPIRVTEYMKECWRETQPWKKWPNRMLRHKTLIQCARVAFSFAGIMEPDEYERYVDHTVNERPSLSAQAERPALAAPVTVEGMSGLDLAHVHRETQFEPSKAADGPPPAAAREEGAASPASDPGSVAETVDEAAPEVTEASLEDMLAFLQGRTKMIWPTVVFGADEDQSEVYKTQFAIAVAEYPAPPHTSEEFQHKWRKIKENMAKVIKGEEEPETIRMIVANIAGLPESELQGVAA
jgi:hypothetical protein